MKCPKCGYLGFESSERCRHCGYDFGLSGGSSHSAGSSVAAGDFTLRDRGRQGDEGPLRDLPLRDHPAARQTPGNESDTTLPAQPTRTEDLPLFWAPPAAESDDAPLITRPSPPRPPLVVRRASPEVPRGRREGIRTQQLDWPTSSVSPLDDAQAAAPGGGTSPHVPEIPAPREPMGTERTAITRSVQTDAAGQPLLFETAALSARIVAVAIDLLLLASIDAVVTYLTIRIGGISFADWRTMPMGPLLAFFVVQNGGYFVVFTSGGQTLGKMAAGIRVVTVPECGPVDFGRALRRTVGWALLAAPCGLGFLTALFASDGRGLHDRWAGTRVVRAVPTSAAMVR